MVAQWERERDDERLIDLIYDAAFDDALWQSVLEELGDRAGAHPGNLLQINVVDGHGFGVAARAPDDVLPRYFAQWAQRNPIGLVEDAFDYRNQWAPRITRDSDCVERSVLESTPYWNEFLVPVGACHNINIRLALRDDDLTAIGLGRPAHLGAFEDDEIAALVPFHRHLIHAERIWRSLGLRQAEFDQFDALLAASPDALFFLDEQFRPLRWTVAADTLLRRSSALRITGGRLHAVGSEADAALQQALGCALRAGAPSPVTLPARFPGDALTCSIMRLGKRASAGVGSGRSLLVTVRASETRDARDALRSRHGLTSAEADLALALTAGESLKAIATRRAVSINTVRNQLSAVFDKTECRRQQDLVRLVTLRNG